MNRHPHPLQSRDLEPQEPAREGDGADLLRQIQICRRLGISDETWRRWRARKITPAPVDLPGAPRWRVRDIDAFVEGRRPSTGRRHYFGKASGF